MIGQLINWKGSDKMLPWSEVQGAAEWTPTFLKVTGKGMLGVGRRGRWQQFERVVSLSVDTMSWSGEHRGFVIEAFFKNDSVTATQRAFRTRFGLYATDAVPDRKTIMRWVSNVRASGSALPRKPSGRPRNFRTPENVQ